MDSRITQITLERGEDGGWTVSCNLPGCLTQGDTLEETLANMQEAIALYLEVLDEEEDG